MLTSDQLLMIKSVKDILVFVETIAVILVALVVLRAEVMTVLQSHGEAYRKISARLRGKEEACKFRTLVKCTCNAIVEISCTERANTDVVIAGISDNTIH